MSGLPRRSGRERVELPPPDPADRTELTRTWLATAGWLIAIAAFAVVVLAFLNNR